MIKLLLSFYAVLFAGAISSCRPTPVDTPPLGNWVRRSDFDGVARSEAVSMVIGDTAYFGTGYDGVLQLKDFWKYDAINNYWIQRAEFAGEARRGAVAFAVGVTGYLGTGYNGRQNLKDIWAFNPSQNSWVRKADFAGTARYDAVAFSVAGKGYITTGFDGNALKDFYEYNPAADTAGASISPWTQKPAMGGIKRSAAVAFVYNNKAYLFTGINNGQTNQVNDMWQYDPATSQWTAKRAIANVSADAYDDGYAMVRQNAVAFVMNGKGYLSCGENGNLLKDTWEYDFDADLWTKKTAYEGFERTGAVGFTVLNRGFLVSGRNSHTAV